jgi:Uma2 family endonuclease
MNGHDQERTTMATTSGLPLDEFLRLEETKPATEYACGEAFQKPMPNGPHSSIQAFLTTMLFLFLSQTKLGRVFTEYRCIFGPPGRQRTYVPDLSYVSLGRLAGDRYVPRHLLIAPDLAIEVLSPDQHMAHFLDKIQFYLLYGVRLVWVIDPATATVTVQVPGEEARILSAGDTLEGGDMLPGFRVAVDDIFAQMQV